MTSVEARERRIDLHGLPQHAVERPPRRARARSTRAAGTCRRRGPGSVRPWTSRPSLRREAQQLRLRAPSAPQPAHVRSGVLTPQLARPPPAPSASATAAARRARSSSGRRRRPRRPARAPRPRPASRPPRRRSPRHDLGLLRRRAPGAPGRRSTREPGSAAFGQRLPFERIAAQRPEKSPPPSPSPPKAASASAWANSVSRLDVDLPARQPRGEAGVQALLADRERELVVRDDDGRLLGLVVDVDLADARGRERLRDEARRLRVPRDDVDLLAAELRDDHAHARAARADAGADRVDALGVRLDGDLRAVARLAGDAADLDEAVGDLGHLELEERLDQLGIAAREDHLRPLRAGAHLGDDRLDAGALLVALAVDLLGARQQRLDLAEVDEDVVAVAGLLDDAGDDLALTRSTYSSYIIARSASRIRCRMTCFAVCAAMRPKLSG